MIVDCNGRALGASLLIVVELSFEKHIVGCLDFFMKSRCLIGQFFLFFFPFLPQGPLGFSLETGISFFVFFVPLLLLTPLRVFVKTGFHMVFAL